MFRYNDGTEIKVGDEIAISSFSKLGPYTHQGKAHSFGKDALGKEYMVFGNGCGGWETIYEDGVKITKVILTIERKVHLCKDLVKCKHFYEEPGVPACDVPTGQHNLDAMIYATLPNCFEWDKFKEVK